MTKIDSNDTTVIYLNGKKFDLNLLDRLKNQKTGGSIWAQYDSKSNYGNENSIFDAEEIQAIKDDLLTMAKNGNIDEGALAVILGNKEKADKAASNINYLMLRQKSDEEYMKYANICTPVSTAVRIPEVINVDEITPKKAVNKTNEQNGKTSFVEQFEDYTPKDLQKFNKVWRYADQYTDKTRAKQITKMVCALSEKYGVDPEIIMPILKHETGGFVFEKRTMNPDNKQYKGVMQVSPAVIKSMYANPDDVNNVKLPRQQRLYAGEHQRFANDDKRIQELKSIYKTPEELYDAIKTDVALGLEVGIMAYKSKLTYSKGNTLAALKLYCGNQYGLPKDTTATPKIWPIPKYKAE